MTNHPVLPLLDRITPEQFQLWSSSVTTRAEFETLNQSWDDLATPDFARLSFEQTKNWIRTVARRTGELK